MGFPANEITRCTEQPVDISVGVGELGHPAPGLFSKGLGEGDPLGDHPRNQFLQFIRDEGDAGVARLDRLKPLAEVKHEAIPRGRDHHRVVTVSHRVNSEPELLGPPLSGCL